MNNYSEKWFDLFLFHIPEKQTEKEIFIIKKYLPVQSYKCILDICCGTGRHAVNIEKNGYSITGIDTNKIALEHARRASNSQFINLDMRLTVHFEYQDGSKDIFDWQIYSPDEFAETADTCGFKIVKSFSNFDDKEKITSRYPRMQFVLEKTV